MSGPSLVRVGGIPFVAADTALACALALEATGSSGGPPPRTFRFANAWCIVSAVDDPAYSEVLCGPGMNFADGRPVAKIVERETGLSGLQVRGADFLERMLMEGVHDGIRHYFYGSTDETLERLRVEIERRFPGAVVVGFEAPPFATKEHLASEEVAQRISRTAPDFIWVGLGTPKQDFVALELAKRTGVPTAAVGAAFEFLAGTVRSAPAFVSRLGLEWAFRLAMEPRRLWRRYLIGNARFVAIVAKAHGE